MKANISIKFNYMEEYREIERKKRDAILKDKQLNFLNSKRAEIISLAVPINYVDEYGNIKTEWLDERNHPQLKTIEELIKFRTEQIIRHYS